MQVHATCIMQCVQDGNQLCVQASSIARQLSALVTRKIDTK